MVGGARPSGMQAIAARRHAVADFAIDVCSTLDLEDVQARCTRRLIELVPGRAHGANVHFGNFTGWREVPVKRVHRGADDRMLAAYPGMARDPFLQCAYRTKDPVHDGKLFRDSGWLEEDPIGKVFTEYGIRHGLLVPVFSGTRLVGHMFVLRDVSMPAFDEREVALTRELGRWTGVAFENALIHSRALATVTPDGRQSQGQPHEERGEIVLTERERDILELVARGLRDAEIAGALTISRNTVKHHLKNVYSKLGAQSRTDAVWIAMRRGLCDGPDRALVERDSAQVTGSK